jgi:hypothetical protein
MFLTENVNEMDTKVDVRKYLSDIFVIQIYLKQEKLHPHCSSPSI